MKLAPLISSTEELSPAEKQRYARHFTLPGVGVEGQGRLKKARVLSIGAGGLGSPVLLYLAAAGVGTLGIIDDDRVDTSNLQRQIIHPQESVGTPKVESAAASIKKQNPLVSVITHPYQLTAQNALEIIADYDLVIDGSDNFATRYLVNDACEALGKPLIWGTISQYTAQVSLFWSKPVNASGAILTGPTLRDLYPEIPAADSVPTCAAGGVLGSLCGTVGSIMASEAIKLISGLQEVLLGKLWLYDCRTHTTRTLSFQRDPQRSAVPLEKTLQEIKTAGMSQNEEPVAELTLEQYRARAGELVALDVREPEERQAGHYPDAGNLPHARLLEAIAAAHTPQELPAPLAEHAQDQVLIYCAGGVRSAKVVRALAKKFPDIRAYSLAGGYR